MSALRLRMPMTEPKSDCASLIVVMGGSWRGRPRQQREQVSSESLHSPPCLAGLNGWMRSLHLVREICCFRNSPFAAARH
jgi:hypothetical protein